MPRGGFRPGAGRKPNSTKAKIAEKAMEALENVVVNEESVAGEILLDINYREQYRKIFKIRGNHATKARLLTHLLDKCTGKPFTAQNPQAKKQIEDPRLLEAIKKLQITTGASQGAPLERTPPETDPKKIM